MPAVSVPCLDAGDANPLAISHLLWRDCPTCLRPVLESDRPDDLRMQDSGMVERFNGRISDVVSQTRFGSSAELESTLRNYVKIYNHSIPQRALKHQPPIQALKLWQEKKPDLFVKRVYNPTGLDTYRVGLDE